MYKNGVPVEEKINNNNNNINNDEIKGGYDFENMSYEQAFGIKKK